MGSDTTRRLADAAVAVGPASTSPRPSGISPASRTAPDAWQPRSPRSPTSLAETLPRGTDKHPEKQSPSAVSAVSPTRFERLRQHQPDHSQPEDRQTYCRNAEADSRHGSGRSGHRSQSCYRYSSPDYQAHRAAVQAPSTVGQPSSVVSRLDRHRPRDDPPRKATRQAPRAAHMPDRETTCTRSPCCSPRKPVFEPASFRVCKCKTSRSQISPAPSAAFASSAPPSGRIGCGPTAHPRAMPHQIGLCPRRLGWPTS